MFDRVINRIGVPLALLFMVIELSYINAKSLFYLTSETSVVDKGFSVVGAIAFSVVTVVVMRKGNNDWIKIVFPVFDAVLVFLGFNLIHAQGIMDGSDNPIRFYLTLFFAVFTGVITYSLGIINYRDHITDIGSHTTHFASVLTDACSDFELLQGEMAKTKSELNLLLSECEVKESEHKILKRQFADMQRDSQMYKLAYLSSERSRILKKKEANRTEEELMVLKETEKQ